MALLALTNAYILLGASDLSDHCSSLELDVSANELDATTFATAGWSASLGGLKSGSLKLSIKGDYAATNIDSILWAMLGTVQTFDIKAVNGARSTSNPSYTGSVLVSKLMPVQGKVGDLVDFDLTWPTTGAVTRQIV